jgi:hypothetical protein
MIRMLNTLLVISMLLAALGQIIAITQKTNIYDAMPTRCGAHLRDVCPSTGIHWGK